MTDSTNSPAINPSTHLQQSWRQALIALVLLLVWTLFLYRDTGLAMATIWYRSETFTHGFLVPPIVLWLIWRQRRAIAVLAPRPMVGALAFVAMTAFVWLLGEMVAVNAVTQLAFVAMLVLCVPVVLGVAVTRSILFPLAFLFFCVPIGEFLLPQLMEWTANFTVLALRLSGIPVYREGLQFVIPSGNWSVVEACSGVRYLIASLTVGTLFAYLNYTSTTRRVLFIGVSILVPVLANWLRAYMIVMLGHYSGNKLAVGVDHLIYGWVFFGIVIMMMFIVGARWAEPELEPAPAITTSTVSVQSGNALRLWGVTLTFALFAVIPVLAAWSFNQSKSVSPLSLGVPAALAGDWRANLGDRPDFKPVYENPTGEINATYMSGERRVGLYLGYYRQQNYERKLVSSSNVLVPGKGSNWAQVASGSRTLVINGNQVALRTAELRGNAASEAAKEGRLVVWQIYWINGSLTASDYLAKMYSAFYRLTGRGDDSAVIVVYTSKDQMGGGEMALESFMSANFGAINEVLSNARQVRH